MPVARTRVLSIVAAVAIITACGGQSASVGASASASGAAAASPSAASIAPLSLRIAGGQAQETNNGQQVKIWANEISVASGGKITATPHYGDIGADVDILHGAQNGSIDCIFDSTDIISSVAPKMSVFSLPFIFGSYQQVYAVEDGSVGKGLLDGLASAGLVGLAYSDLGFRNFANNVRPINTPNDLKGLKLRTLQGQIPTATVQAFGAVPLPLAATEIYTSLQTHNIDGLDMPVPYFLSAKLYEVVKYYSLSRHTFTAMAFACSKTKWDTLSPAQQDAIRKATASAAQKGRAYDKDLEEKGLQDLKSKGVQINDVSDLSPFRQLAQSVYDLAGGTVGKDTIQSVQQAANAAK